MEVLYVDQIETYVTVELCLRYLGYSSFKYTVCLRIVEEEC